MARRAATKLAEGLYRARVAVLAILFLLAMAENSRHPFPLWADILGLVLPPPRGSAGTVWRSAAILPFFLLYAGSLFLRLSATASLGPMTVWSAEARTGAPVSTGPYGLLRHPLYAGSAGMILALSALSSPEGAALLSGLGLPFLAFLARLEESRLSARHPDYRTYRIQVPALWPRKVSPHTFLGSLLSPLRTHAGTALRSESPNVALLAGFATFWITPDLTAFWISFLIGLAGAFAAPFLIPAGMP